MEPDHVDTGIQTHESDLDVGDHEGECIGDYVIPKDEEIYDRIAARYLFVYRRGDRSIDTIYVIRREASGTFMIGDTPLSVEENGDVTVLGVTYEGTEGLSDLLTKTNIDRSLFTTNDMRSYKYILEPTNGHLSYNDSSGHIKTPRGPNYRDVISKMFTAESRRRSQQRQRWTTFRQWSNFITNPRKLPHSHRCENSKMPA
jgi:hypothetical protein